MRAGKCYLRPEVSQLISDSRVDIESNVVLIGLSLITCVAAFLVLSGGLIF